MISDKTFLFSNYNEYVPSVGVHCGFGLISKELQGKYFTSCRELFHEDWGCRYVKSMMDNSIIVFKNHFDLNKINKFFNIVHRKLKLKEKIIFYKSNIAAKSSFVVSVPKFWRKNDVRREIFSVLMRAACMYNGSESLNKCLSRYIQIRHVIHPIKHFLNGNVNLGIKVSLYNGYNNGFISTFESVGKDEIKSILVKRKKIESKKVLT